MTSLFIKRIKALAVTAALAAGFVIMPASTASASGSNCAWSHGNGGTVCLGVDGVGYKVNWVRVSHSDGWQPWLVNYCGFQSRFSGRLTGGNWYSATFGYTAGCTPAPYYNNHDVNNYFRKGQSVIGETYHDGNWAPGTAGVAIQ